MQSKSEAIDEERQQAQVRFRPAPSPSTSKAADIDPSVTLVTGNQWNCRAKETFSVPTLGRYIEYSATDGLRQNGSTSHHGSALKQCSDESVGQQLTAVCGHLIGALQICIDSLKQHVDALLLEQTSTGEDRKPEYAVLYKLKPAQHRLRQLQLQLAAVQEVKAKILSTTSVKLNSSASMSQTGRMTVQKLKRAKSRLMRADPDQLKCHSELEIYMGSISFRPKGVAGFARVTKGDQFEIVVKHGAQKHRMRTKVGLEREQAWNPAEVVFKCTLGEVFELKVQEVKSFSKTTLLDTYLHYSELTVPEPIVLSIDLKRSGTLKLYVVVSWDALDFSGQAAFDYAAQSLKWRSMNTLGRTKKTRARSIIIDSISGGQLPYVSRSLSACGADYYPIPRARSQQAINNVQSPEQTLDDPLEEMLDNIAAGVRQLLSRFPEISGFYHAVNRLRFGLAFSTREDADHLPHRMTEMRLNNPAEPVDYHDLRDDSFKRSTVMADDICLGYASETRVLQFRATIRHHLIHCQLLLQLNRQGPLQYQKKRALIKLGQETEIVNCMAKLSDHLPRLASVSYVLSDHKASIELQNVWLSACRNGSYFILPMARVSSELRIHYGDVVCSYYPELLDKVMASLRHSLSDESRWAPQEVSVFQFITFFRDQLLVVLIESLAHETWINEGLKSRDVNMVSNIIEKLKQSPVVPPINCVRYVGMTLVDELSRLRTVAESYLLSLEGTMREDIVSKFIIFLEHEDPLSRRGACRSLAVLNAKRSVDLLLFVSSHDRNPLVRNEARKALLAFGIAKL